MKLTAAFPLAAAVNTDRRTIIGQIVPYGETGQPGLNGSGVQLEIEAGGLTWDDSEPIRLRSMHHAEPVGRAVTLDESASGVMATFAVINTTAGTDALELAKEGLQAGLSIEAEAPDNLTASDDGVYRLTADNPARLTAVALVESPAFQSARVHSVAASRKETPMADEPTTVDAPDAPAFTKDDLIAAVTAGVREAITQLPGEEAGEGPTDLRERLTAATTVTREPFPYGHPGAEGTSFFKDIMAAKLNGDSIAAARAEKANDMIAAVQASRGPRGKQFIATDSESQALITAANEPVVRSTLIVPNVYDPSRYVEELVNPRVIADHVPGVNVSAPNPIVIPAFSSSAADGGSGEIVVASTEGTNPAQGEVATTSITVTPIWYHGLLDVSRQAVDAGSPVTDALMMATLMNSYNEVTEAAAVTAILANGTAGTDVASNADTTGVEPQSAQKAIRLEMAKMHVGLKRTPQAVLFASDVYQVAVGADNAAGTGPLYPFLADRYQAVNQAASIGDDMLLNVYNRPGYLAHALTATKFVVVNWSGVIRYESPLQQFTLNEVVAPASVRFAVGGYFVQRTLQAQAVRYFAQA